MAEWNRDDIPWRQGHFLCKAAIEALGLHDPAEPDQTLVIVASHDCDLAQVPEAEPSIEVIIGRRITDKDGNNTHAKNARKLHLEVAGELGVWAEFEATGKRSIEKLALSDFLPRADAHLSPENHVNFQLWLASRYRRSAFPDEFERRLTKETKLAEKISKAVKPHAELISGVFFDVDDGVEVHRNGPADTYTLDIIILHTSEPNFEAAEAAAKAAAEAIENAFKEKLFSPTNTWQQIELRFCAPVSESVLTYQEFKQLKRWRLEHISRAAEPPQPTLAE